MTAPRFISTLSWAKRFVSLDGGKFDPREYPQLKEIADTVDRRCGCTFILRFPPQTFKSLFMQLRLARTIAVTPARALWYCKTGKDVENFSDEKLRKLLEDTVPVRSKFAIKEDSRGTKTLFRFVDAPVSLLGADIESHRNQRSAEDLYLDETWQFEPGHIADIRKRSESFKHTRRILMSETAPEDGSESDTLFKRSSRRVWQVVCTLCKERIELEMGDKDTPWGFKWDEIKGTDGFWDSAASAKTVRYVCPACNGSILPSAATLKKLSDPARGACYVGKNGDPDPKIEGWTASGFVFGDWVEQIAEFLDANNAKILGELEPLKVFTQKILVKPWVTRDYLRDTTEYPVLPYKLRDEWADEANFAGSKRKMRFVWVDVQQHCFWGLCRKWAADGRSRLHDFRQLFTAHEIASFAEECGVDKSLVFVDHAYDPKQRGKRWGRTTKLCSEFGFAACNAIGQESFLHEGGIRRMYSEPYFVDAWQGEKEMGQKPVVFCLNYSSNGAKHMLHNLRQQKHPATGEWMFSIPEDATDEYRKQAYAEILVRKKNPKGGTIEEWQQIEDDNHAFDLEAGQVVTANMFGVAGASALRSMAETKKPEAAVTVDARA